MCKWVIVFLFCCDVCARESSSPWAFLVLALKCENVFTTELPPTPHPPPKKNKKTTTTTTFLSTDAYHLTLHIFFHTHMLHNEPERERAQECVCVLHLFSSSVSIILRQACCVTDRSLMTITSSFLWANIGLAASPGIGCSLGQVAWRGDTSTELRGVDLFIGEADLAFSC